MSTITLPRNRSLTLSDKTHVMGIINCTPDSFYQDSRAPTVSEALAHARSMLDAGVDILDIGGESTRPGSSYVEAEAERDRVVPVVEAIRNESDVPISVDTRKRSVAEAALAVGADMINDVSALRDDPELAAFIADEQIPIVLMHMRGTPQTMQKNPQYVDTVGEVQRELAQFVDQALASGIKRTQIIIDPGIGFGKTVADNLRLIKSIDAFRMLGYPILLGASRKSFIGKTVDSQQRASDERLAGTLAVHAYAIMHGVEIIRAHDVQETIDVRRMLTAIAEADQTGAGEQ